MSLHRVFDAARPPQTAPPGCDGVLGYIGGMRAAHVWTLAEWQRFAGLVQFPAYVPNVSVEAPVEAAIAACTGAKAFGWAPWQQAKRVIVCDLETEVVRGWYAQFAGECEQQGFTACAYGSLSTVLENAAADVWAASWNGSATLLAGQTIHAHQFEATSVVDFSAVDDWLFARGGQGPRHT